MKSHRYLIALFILFGFVITELNAQDLKFEYLTPDEGLSQSTVPCIIQDKIGFMWFGTNSGLNKYDGYKFTKYYRNTQDTTSIAGDLINSIFEDRKGELWIGSDGGLSLYNRDLDVFINYLHNEKNPNSLSGQSVYCLFEDKLGQLWVGTIGAGLNLFDRKNNKFIHYIHNENDPTSISGNNIHAILEDKDGGIWVGTENMGLNRFDPKTQKFTHFLHVDNDPNSIAHNNITSLAKDLEGNLWVGTLGGGICRIIKGNNGNYIFEAYKPVTTDENRSKVLALFTNQRNGIWIGTENGGLDYFDIKLKKFSNYHVDENTPSSLNNNSVHAIFEDKGGNLWVGTYTGGVNVVKKNKKKIDTYRRIPGNPNSLSYNAVSCFYEDDDGKLWIGTDGGGVNVFNRLTGKVEHYNKDNTSLKSNAILTITRDADDDIWVGGWECALNLFNRNTKSFTTFTMEKNGIPNNNIFDILVDHKGRIWMCFGGVGFAEFHKSTKSFTVYTPDNSKLNSIWPLNLIEDHAGNIVIGHTSGISIFNPETKNFENYSYNENVQNSLSNNQINVVITTRDSTLWIGTINGLDHLDPKTKKITRYFEQNGLPNNNIAGLVEDNNGNLWISTANGISKLEMKTGNFMNYKLTDGLQGKSYIRNSCFKSSVGEVLFGGTNGCNIFIPDSLHDNPVIPPVVITDFTIFNKPVKINGPKSPLKKDISQTKQLTLTYKQSVFSFEFVALEYTAPSQNQYAYMLEGFDKEWNYVGTKRSASYTNLDAGTYTFRVKGSNNDGKWNEEGTSIVIKIKPPFWKTWVFRIAVVLTVLYLIYFIYRKRMDEVKRDKEILEQKLEQGEEVIEQKIQEVEAQKEELRERDKRELEIRFMNEGIVKFSEIIASLGVEHKKMTSGLISELTQYVGCIMGTLYILDDDDPDNPFLYMESSFSVERDDTYLKCKPGEGLIGTCFIEAKTIIVDNIPEGYAKLSSGLGDAIPQYIYLVPLKYSETVQGVIEVASFDKLEDYKVKFLEKISENITSYITISKANKRTEQLLEQAGIQKNELQAQEEELRQNLEEMQATQEDVRRQMETAARAQEELQKEKVLIDTMLKNVPESIYFKDTNGCFIKTSDSLAKNAGYNTSDDIIGKSDLDLWGENSFRQSFEDEMNIMKSGVPMIDKIEKGINPDGKSYYVSTTKMPLRNHKNEIIGTFGISKDISEHKQMEEEVRLQNEELQSQEEELRQNLEEMLSTQEEMKRREERWLKEKQSIKEQETKRITEITKLEKELNKLKSDK